MSSIEIDTSFNNLNFGQILRLLIIAAPILGLLKDYIAATMTSFLDSNRSFSFYAMPVAWALCIAPHVYAITLYDRVSPVKKFDRINPRTLVPSLDMNQSLDSVTKQKIARAEAAQLNGYENVGFFAAAVVAANVTKVDLWWTNTMTITYLVSRVIYNIVYINGVKGPVRGIPFYCGVGSVFAPSII